MWRSLALIALLACGDATGSQLPELLRGRERWRELGPADYDFSYQHAWAECSSFNTWVVKVRGGKAVEIVRTTTPCFGNAASTTEVEVDASRSMNWIFDFALAELSKSEHVAFEFDPVLGFPNLIRVDETLQMADDEFTLSVRISKIGL